ncbi:hypothetical protein [uncultured Parabacteroides sp.]|uniref:hypothetical protein n=1 Tax=uncultured Parabacteroides sp. TaxID=512312 RepID=UPI002623F64B|nr:hypothetical protein [uncultured Parabacteroides sp.]
MQEAILFKNRVAFLFPKQSVFPFLTCKGSLLPSIAQGGPSGRLAEKKSSSLRSGIFFRQALPQSRQKTDRKHVRNKNTGCRAGHVSIKK